MRPTISIAAAVLSALVGQPGAFGGVLFDQGPAARDAPSALRSNLPGPETNQQVADNFVLASAADLSGISWTGFYFDSSAPSLRPTVEFTVRLFEGESVGAAPLFEQSVQATSAEAGVTDGWADPIYTFSAALSSPVALEENRTYWLSVLDSDSATTVDFRWLRTTTPVDAGYALRSNEGSSWRIFPDATGFAFALTGTAAPSTVPEPSSFVLLALGAAAAGGTGLRRRNGMPAPSACA